ncbi:hypothetical protein [Streptomyces sp. AC558_RSS880]|uniref:hypothetical protein n=1 Tax=Streptomyces sp. AC558_RSS880 TaxID=2823687 RepID=UPI001C226C9F|nr:hypothetical protein [Streptomyces sp. AC558_RSS880]
MLHEFPRLVLQDIQLFDGQVIDGPVEVADVARAVGDGEGPGTGTGRFFERGGGGDSR